MDMSSVIVPKSDQWNFDDFQAGPLTFEITGVTVKRTGEQPVDISLKGTSKFYRPCKSMARVMVAAWGADSSKYVGRSFTLYGDPKVKWGGMEVGGIRISHMSDIADDMTMALTVTRANKKPFTVRPIQERAAGGSSVGAMVPPSAPSASAPSPDEALVIKGLEWAELGTEKYAAWWTSLTAIQRKALGHDRHTIWKAIAERVPA